jgi:hypothetical protein
VRGRHERSFYLDTGCTSPADKTDKLGHRIFFHFDLRPYVEELIIITYLEAFTTNDLGLLARRGGEAQYTAWFVSGLITSLLSGARSLVI